MISTDTVCFSHGKESGPWGIKITALAEIARNKGFSVVSIDYTGEPDPDVRVRKLCREYRRSEGLNILVGSSMGGYVAAVASREIKPEGLFLMAPAVAMSGYREQFPIPVAGKSVVVHGWDDSVIPYAHSLDFARTVGADLHLLQDGHDLISALPTISALFSRFLDSLKKYA